MTLTALPDNALQSVDGGFVLHLGLPWIRSLPLASLQDLWITIDGEAVDGLTVELDGRRIDLTALADEAGWWFLQDRLAVHGDRALTAGAHNVSVTFRLTMPYMQAGPDSPLSLPFNFEKALTLDAAALEVRHSEPQSRPSSPQANDITLPTGWTMAASAFNWTPEVIRSDRPAPDIAIGIVSDGVASVIELEPGQMWRSFPETTDPETDAFHDALSAAGGSVSIVGASLDDWLSTSRRRSDAERFAFLHSQLHAANRVGAKGVRLPIGQAGEPLLRELIPALHELDLVLYEEIGAQQTPSAPGTDKALDTIARVDDSRVRVLVDTSMLMPSLPPSYLELLRHGGVPEDMMSRLATDWQDPATHEAVIDLLRSGGVPPHVHTTYMNLLVRFGRSRAGDLRPIIPLVGAVHLKFWDLDDDGGRVTQPVHDIAAELASAGFTGSLCSEWGGHEWLDDDPTDMTRGHLALARAALGSGAASVL